MKHTHILPLFGLLPMMGLAGCSFSDGDRTPEVTNAARLSVAMAAEASGDNQMALQIYATALAKDPSDIQAAVRYARALVNNRQVGLARELLTRQLAARPSNPDLSREFATLQVMQGQAGAALAHFDTALLANPGDVRALVNKGIALDMLGQHAEAQILYRRADGLSPDDPTVRSNLAMSLMLSGQTEQAHEVMQGVADANGTTRMRNNMALVAAANGDMARARQLTGGEVTDVELRSLAAQLRSTPRADVPVPQPSPVANAEPLAPAPMPVSVGAIPLVVPAQGQVEAPAASPVRASPMRTQDKRGASRLNMTEVTPAVVARALESALEKEAAFIGEGPSVMPGPALAANTRVVSAVATAPVRVRQVSAVAAPVGGPRIGYTVQIAAVGSEDGARSELRRLNRRAPQLLVGREAVVEQLSGTESHYVWRLRTPGFASLGQARDFCGEMKLGGLDCYVVGRDNPDAALVRLPSMGVRATTEASG